MPVSSRKDDPGAVPGAGAKAGPKAGADRGTAGAETGAVAGADRGAAALTVMRLFRALERVDSGLSPHQYRILKMAGAGGERSARLAERLAVAKPTLTTTADALVAAGLLHREAEIGDRRVVRLCLTQAGQAAVEQADAAYSGWLARLLEATGDPGQILRDLDLLDSAMDELRGARLAKRAGRLGQAPDEDRPDNPVSSERTQAVTDTARPGRRPAAGGAE